jgi:actin-related protein 4
MPDAVLSSFSLGRRSALIVDISASAITVSPVVDGYVLQNATIRSNGLSSNQLDTNISDILARNQIMLHCIPKKSFEHLNSSFLRYKERFFLRDIKHHVNFIPHYNVETSARSIEGLQSLGVSLVPSYELPDGQVVYSTYSLSCAAEYQLFPSSFGESRKEKSEDLTLVQDHRGSSPRKRSPSLSKNSLLEDTLPFNESLTSIVYQAIMNTDVDIRRELWSNIYLVGGGSLLSGLHERLQWEMEEILPTTIKVKLHHRLPLEHKFASWIGGSILSICGSFHQHWISRAQYDELGRDRIIRLLK